MDFPEDYRDALAALTNGLNADEKWEAGLTYNRRAWGGQAVSAALVLTGPTAPRYVAPWHDDEHGALGAFVFTDRMLIELRADAEVNGERKVSATGVPLVVEALEVTVSQTPWDENFAAPAWPGTLSAVVHVKGRESFSIPAQPVTNQGDREAVQGVISDLIERLAEHS